jgi:hypothetical protein
MPSVPSRNVVAFSGLVSGASNMSSSCSDFVNDAFNIHSSHSIANWVCSPQPIASSAPASICSTTGNESRSRQKRRALLLECIKPPIPVAEDCSFQTGMVRGFSSADSTPDSGVRELRDELTAAMEDGNKRALLILDGGYQFAVSIGVYVRVKSELVM